MTRNEELIEKYKRWIKKTDKMKTLFINGLQFKFDRIIEFEQTDTNLLECFFFNGSEIVTSQFLTLFELNNIRNEQD